MTSPRKLQRQRGMIETLNFCANSKYSSSFSIKLGNYRQDEKTIVNGDFGRSKAAK